MRMIFEECGGLLLASIASLAILTVCLSTFMGPVKEQIVYYALTSM